MANHLSLKFSGVDGVTNMSHRVSTRNLFGPTTQTDPSAVPPNICGSRIFLIKLQFDSNHPYIYDRKRSMKCFFMQDDGNREIFIEFVTEMMHPPRLNYDGLEMHR